MHQRLIVTLLVFSLIYLFEFNLKVLTEKFYPLMLAQRQRRHRTLQLIHSLLNQTEIRLAAVVQRVINAAETVITVRLSSQFPPLNRKIIRYVIITHLFTGASSVRAQGLVGI